MQQTRETIPALLTVNEIAGALRLSPSAIYRAIDAGEIKALRVTSRPGGIAARPSLRARAHPRDRRGTPIGGSMSDGNEWFGTSELGAARG